jgi:hypothetical protein
LWIQVESVRMRLLCTCIAPSTSSTFPTLGYLARTALSSQVVSFLVKIMMIIIMILIIIVVVIVHQFNKRKTNHSDRLTSAPARAEMEWR